MNDIHDSAGEAFEYEVIYELPVLSPGDRPFDTVPRIPGVN